MSRRKLMQHLRQQGCVMVREGGRHTVVRNPASGRQSQVPRHREIDSALTAQSASNSTCPRRRNDTGPGK
jgi:predicted RNA binding protein YcfA (HicA-like mRNA interferase family)